MILDETPDRLGPLTGPAAAALSELAAADAVARAWAADHTLWRDDPTELADRLGWLTVVPDMTAHLDDIAARCAGLAAGVDHLLLAGMGGSSLFPEVVARSGAAAASAPHLHVLDTTDPAAVARFDAELRVATTVGLGPRFLHSTGQLHKGGPATGVFVQVVAEVVDDVPIPGADYGFAALERAQADGDLLTLRDRKRRVGRVRVDELLEVTR